MCKTAHCTQYSEACKADNDYVEYALLPPFVTGLSCSAAGLSVQS